MRERYTITITDYRGSRHYTLNQLMRRALAAALGVVGLVFLCGSLTIYALSENVSSLSGELDSLRQYQAELSDDNQALIDEQNRLLASVQEKSRALTRVSQDLGQLESLIGLKPEPKTPLMQRIDLASMTAHEKRLMLESIPSGYPLAQKVRLTSSYGVRKHPVMKETAMHGGVDFAADLGTPVYATADGLIEWAGMHESSGLGKMIKVVHNYGFSTIYGHLNETRVRVGDYIRRGDLIGHSGNTGMSSGPHLHYEVRHLYRRLNPEPFLQWSIDNYDVVFTREERVQWESLAETVRKMAIAPERQWSQQALTLSAISSSQTPSTSTVQ